MQINVISPSGEAIGEVDLGWAVRHSRQERAVPDNSADDPTITPREAEVANLVSQGLANKIVAQQLGIREGTVKVHLHNIYQKLHVSNRTALILSRAPILF